MSLRSERREADRLSRKLAYQQLRKQSSAAEQTDSSLPALLPAAPSVSAAQLQANRANAQFSTGPLSSQGKAISSRNNTRHGLAGGPDGESFLVLLTESQTAYDQSLADFRAEWKPVTATERDLVNRMVMHQWLSRRALRLQETLFDPESGEITDVKKFELYRRYEGAHERGFNKAFADIQRLRSFQLRQQNGFESQSRKNEEHQFKIRRLQRQEDLQIQKISSASKRTDLSNASIQPVERMEVESIAAI